MNRELDFSREAVKFLKKIPSKHARQVAKKIHELLGDPLPEDSIQMQNSPFHRVDSGEYRIIYEFDQTTVRIPVIGKGNDGEVYKKAKRKQ